MKKAVKIYCELKKIYPELRAINIGWGMPIRNSLGFEFDYSYMVKEIVLMIQQACKEDGIVEPDILTEFGKYTVGESGATIFSVLGQKQQNQSELWYMIDNSLMNTIPDSWGINERFILLPINKWKNEYTRVNIGGLSCDNSDFYNSEVHENQVYLPAYSPEEAELGLIRIRSQDLGASSIVLFQGRSMFLIKKNSNGDYIHELTTPEQTAQQILDLLGYKEEKE